jgi:hypothetical protein
MRNGRSLIIKMLSIKKIGQKNIWLFTLPLVLLLITFVFFKFFSSQSTINNKNDYLKVVGPKLTVVIANHDSQHIAEMNDFLYNIKTSDRSIGDYHLPLYMAFSLWTKYTETKDLAQITRAIGILQELKITVPELEEPISQIIEIMQSNV